MPRLFNISIEVTNYYEVQVTADSLDDAIMKAGNIRPERFATPSQTTTNTLEFDCEEYELDQEEIEDLHIISDGNGNYFKENGEPYPTKYELADKLSKLPAINLDVMNLFGVKIVWKDDFGTVQYDEVAVTSMKIEEGSRVDNSILYHYNSIEEMIDFIINNSGHDFQIVEITL